MMRATGIDKYPFVVRVLSEGGGARPVQDYAYETLEAATKGAHEHGKRRFVCFVSLSVRLEHWDCQRR